MGVQINGNAHFQLSVLDVDRRLSFWQRFYNFMGMENLIKGEDVIYCIGGRTKTPIQFAPDDQRGGRFDQDRAGLHHFGFRGRSREDVEAIQETIEADPDGIRVEVNHIPGKDHFGREGIARSTFDIARDGHQHELCDVRGYLQGPRRT